MFLVNTHPDPEQGEPPEHDDEEANGRGEAGLVLGVGGIGHQLPPQVMALVVYHHRHHLGIMICWCWDGALQTGSSLALARRVSQDGGQEEEEQEEEGKKERGSSGAPKPCRCCDTS